MANRGKGKGKGRNRAQARFQADRLKATGGILADLNDKASPAKTLLGGVGKGEMAADADAVLAAPEPSPTVEVDPTLLEAQAPAPAEAAPETAPDPEAANTDGPESASTDGQAKAKTPRPSSELDALLDTVSRDGLEPKPPPPHLGADDIQVHIDRPMRVPLESYVKVVKGERVARALARDISENGIYLAAMALPLVQAGDEVRLEVSLPEAEPIWVQGKAVRDLTDQGFHALAIHFQNLAAADRAAIRRYVDARSHLAK